MSGVIEQSPSRAPANPLPVVYCLISNPPRHPMSRRFQTLFLIILPFLIASAAFAQPPDTLWTRIWDYGHDNDFMKSVQALPDGGYIACGYTYYFDVGNQTWTARLDQDGTEVWLHIEGEDGTDAAHFTAPTADSGFIQCGSTISYTPGIQFGAFARKLNSDGVQEWARLFDDPTVFGDGFYCIREIASGGYVAVGHADSNEIYRLSEAGNLVWRRQMPENGLLPQWVEPTSDGGFLVPSSHYNSDVDAYVFTLYKLDRHGLIEWVNDEAEPGLSIRGEAHCVRQDASGDIYACGWIITNPNVTRKRFYVTKRNPDGSILWSTALPEQSGASADHMVILADGSVVAGGWNQAGFLKERWIVKVSSEGEVLWHRIDLSGQVTCLDQGLDGSIIAAYYPSTINEPSTDLALMKLEPEVDIELEVWNPIIPAAGGLLRYGAQVSNILVNPTPLDAWIVVTGPNGDRIPLNSFPVLLQPGATFTRPQINVWVPGYAPNGEYTLEAHLGVAPPTVPPGGSSGSRNMGLASFTFTKGGSR